MLQHKNLVKKLWKHLGKGFQRMWSH